MARDRAHARRDPLGFVVSATTRACQLAMEDVAKLVERDDVAGLPLNTRREVCAILREIAQTAIGLVEQVGG